MSTLKLSLLLFIVINITSCAPFEDRRREPGTDYVYVGASKLGSPAICYNPLLTTAEDVKTMADELCRQHQANTHAVLKDNDVFTCRLFIPSKAYYTCEAD